MFQEKDSSESESFSLEGCLFLFLLSSFGLGLLIGLVVLGWWLWPLQWIDTDPPDLKRSHQLTYVALVADSYAVNNDLELAQARLAYWQRSEVTDLLDEAMVIAEQQEQAQQVENLQALSRALPSEISIPTPTTGASPRKLPQQPQLKASYSICWSFFIGFVLASIAVGMFWILISELPGIT